MGVEDHDQRLSRISTQWTLMFQAHQPEAETAPRGQILSRYHAAVFRYLVGAVGDTDAAEELAQEFALRFLRGDFHRARPERGRFRNYLKTALVNLVNDYHRKRQAAPRALPAETPDRAPASLAEPDFAATWREEVIERTWQALADANPTYHATLLLHVQNPDMASPEMAEALSAQLDRPMNAALVRKTMQRAQEKFAHLLVDEVGATLEAPLEDDLRGELEDLDLLRYCRSSLAERASLA